MKNLKQATISRRTMAALLLGTFAAPSFAISAGGAEQFVLTATGELERIVNSGKSGGGLYTDLSRFFHKYADVTSIARSAIGAPWRGMSARQKTDYVKAFEHFVVQKYGSKLTELRGGKGQVVRSTNKSGGVQVDVDFVWPGYDPRRVVFLISDGSGSPKVLDMKVLGISLLSTETVFIRQALTHNKNDVDKLIERLSR